VVTVNIALMGDGYPTPTRRTQGEARGRHSIQPTILPLRECRVKSSKLRGKWSVREENTFSAGFRNYLARAVGAWYDSYWLGVTPLLGHRNGATPGVAPARCRGCTLVLLNLARESEEGGEVLAHKSQ